MVDGTNKDVSLGLTHQSQLVSDSNVLVSAYSIRRISHVMGIPELPTRAPVCDQVIWLCFYVTMSAIDNWRQGPSLPSEFSERRKHTRHLVVLPLVFLAFVYYPYQPVRMCDILETGRRCRVKNYHRSVSYTFIVRFYSLSECELLRVHKVFN